MKTIAVYLLRFFLSAVLLIALFVGLLKAGRVIIWYYEYLIALMEQIDICSRRGDGFYANRVDDGDGRRLFTSWFSSGYCRLSPWRSRVRRRCFPGNCSPA